MKNLFVLWVVCFGLSACRLASHDMASPSVSPVIVHRLDVALAAFPQLDTDGRDSVLAEYADAVGFLFDLLHQPLTDSSVVAYSESRPVLVFEPDIIKLLPPLDEVESDLGGIARNLGALHRLSMPSIYGIVSPYNQRVFLTDSIVLVGLNHYLGPQYEGYASFPQYLREQKHVQRLPYDVAEALIGAAYPMTVSADRSVTVLEHILYQGALIMAELNLVPDATEPSVLGYSPEQWEWAVGHEADLWQALIGGDYIYNVSPAVADRLIADAPSASFIMPDAPGRIGRFVGLRIVKSYLERNPDTDIEFLLSSDFYANISTLAKSGYSPR